ncbi:MULTISPECIES: bacteriocin-like protein [Chryseobacterium]|uniref:bacteriocin-like protein n=1 Tax=Chryseobacterium TaxID=59732 RepID=UPI000AB3D763
MKNFKKISRNGLKSVLGGGILQCRVGYVYMCNSIYVCDPSTDQYEGCCGCVPKV